MIETNNAPKLTVIEGRAGKAKRVKRNANARKHRVTARQRRTVGQLVAAVGGSFMPVASYTLAHSVGSNPVLWVLVVAALSYSPLLSRGYLARTPGRPQAAPRTRRPSRGFASTSVPSSPPKAAILPYLGVAGLTMLVMINAVAAWSKARGQ
jgi:hypothetical protein